MIKLLDSYTMRLIKENILYILLLIFFCALILIYVPVQMIQYFDLKSKNEQLSVDVQGYKSRRDVTISFSPNELNQLVTALNRLVPNKEDYFSILHSLESISEKSGFKITGYRMGIAKKQTGTIQLLIVGEGTSQSFLEFMNRYRNDGNRLITIDKIEFAPNLAKVTLTLFFYSQDVKSNGSTSTIDKNVLDEIKRLPINEDISTSNNASLSPANTDINYQVKENPFE